MPTRQSTVLKFVGPNREIAVLEIIEIDQLKYRLEQMRKINTEIVIDCTNLENMWSLILMWFIFRLLALKDKPQEITFVNLPLIPSMWLWICQRLFNYSEVRITTSLDQALEQM